MYSVASVPDFSSHLIGKDEKSRPCLLLKASNRSSRRYGNIRLEKIEANLDVACTVRLGATAHEENFTVVRCRAVERELVSYFWYICEALLSAVGNAPTIEEVSDALHAISVIFQKLNSPPSRNVNGLFGELFLIRNCSNPGAALAAWRVDQTARFDFSNGSSRLEVKTTSGRTRVHTFSYAQCNPPENSIALIASMFVEQVGVGISLHNLIRDIEGRVGSGELTLKLHALVASTLGAATAEAMEICFDEQLSSDSLSFFNAVSIPALRGELPLGVSNVGFQSDLSRVSALSPDDVRSLDPWIASFLG